MANGRHPSGNCQNDSKHQYMHKLNVIHGKLCFKKRTDYRRLGHFSGTISHAFVNRRIAFRHWILSQNRQVPIILRSAYICALSRAACVPLKYFFQHCDVRRFQYPLRKSFRTLYLDALLHNISQNCVSHRYVSENRPATFRLLTPSVIIVSDTREFAT